jgi:hypothetical protein
MRPAMQTCMADVDPIAAAQHDPIGDGGSSAKTDRAAHLLCMASKEHD